VIAGYDLAPAEVEVLLEVCRTIDLIDNFEADLDARGLIVNGSKGQPVLSQTVAALSQARSTLTRLLAHLGGDEEEATASSAASALAQQR
jgi:hypothetical protein